MIDFNKTILAPKIGVWASGGVSPLSIGLNLIYYSDIYDFDKGSIRLRPELGLGLFNVRGFVGFNIPISNYEVSKSYVSLVTLGFMYYVPVIKWTRPARNGISTYQTVE